MGRARVGAEDGLRAVEHRHQRADGEPGAEIDQPSGGIERKPRAFADDNKTVLRHRIDQLLVIPPGP